MDDGSRSTLLLLIFIILVIISAYFACAESGFSAVNKVKLKSMADEGNKKAKRALYITNNFDRALTAILIGTNIAHIAAASVATLWVFLALKDCIPAGFDTDSVLNLIATLGTTVIIFLIGEMIPKSLANDRPMFIALNLSGSLRIIMKVLFPLVWFFSAIANLFTRIFASKETPSITEEELYYIIDTAEEEGVMDEEQSDLLKSAMEFSDTTAADVMTMRDDIYAIDISLSNNEIMDAVKNTNHSRIPVYDGNLDKIIGTLPIRNFIKEYYKNPDVNIRTLLIPPFFVKSSAKIDDLLTIMRQHKFYLAAVSDDEGKTLGIVTIEDFLEELVGEIWDEDDVYDANFIKLGGNKFTINTSMNTALAFEKMHCPPPDAHISSRPILSWIIETFGRIPEEGESFTYRNLDVIADTVDENGRVVSVEIDILSEEELMKRASKKEYNNEASSSVKGGDAK